MKFPHVESALEWGTEFISCWRAGRSFSPDSDSYVPGKVRRTGGISNDAADALTIIGAAKSICSGHACLNYPRQFNRAGREQCLFLYVSPDPTSPKPSFSDSEKHRFEGCLAALRDNLRRRGLVE